MTTSVNYNGKTIGATEPLITAGNRGFRYGDGLFETMRLRDGQIALAAYHFERLFAGMRLMDFALPAHFTVDFFLEQITALCRKNEHLAAARVRLTVFRGIGELFTVAPDHPDYIIETFALEPAGRMKTGRGILSSGGINENGLVLGLYKDGCKAPGKFSSIKSNNYLLYAMAARYAKQQQWNDSLILNSNGAVCESAIANVFIIKDGLISTPGLSEGCVAGVMRRFLLEKLPAAGYNVCEQTITLPMVQDADEVFLTNAVQGIRWVQSFGDARYINKEISRIYPVISMRP